MGVLSCKLGSTRVFSSKVSLMRYLLICVLVVPLMMVVAQDLVEQSDNGSKRETTEERQARVRSSLQSIERQPASELNKLVKQHVKTRSRVVELVRQEFAAGMGTIEKVLVAELDLLEAKLDAVPCEERLPVIRDQILALDRSLSEAQMQAEVGIRPITDVELARAAMEEAKIRLAREVLSPPCR